MFLVDTHSHIFLPDFDEDRNEVVSRAVQQGIKYILMPNVDESTFEPLMELNSAYPSVCYPMLAIHPSSINSDVDKQIEWVGNKLSEKPGRFIAVGETGIDLYWDVTYKSQQEKAFSHHIGFGKKYGLPIVIHARNSFNEIFDILEAEKDNYSGGVFHSFSGDTEQAIKAIELGYYLGINGIVTFKKSALQNVVKEIPLEHLIIETDSPYLAPVPKRGTRNESSYVRYIAEFIAELKNVSVEKVAEITSGNACKLFKIKPNEQ